MATPLPGTQTPFGRFVEVSPGQFAFSTPLGVYAPTAGGGFQGFVQSPQGQWTPASQTPAAPTAPAGGGAATTQPTGELCNGVEKPTAGLRQGYEWFCNGEKGWDTRWVGPGPEPTGPDDPMRNPNNPPGAAPEGFEYQWTGSFWQLVQTGKPKTPSTGGVTREESRESAKAIIGNLLEQYGLGNLTDFVNDLITKEDIISADVVLGRIRQTDQYKKRFAANAARRAAGYNAISEAEYVNLENSYRQLMRSSGLPQGFYDQAEDFTDLIAGDVSVAELSNRINEGYLAVQQANPQVVNEMRRLYGVDDAKLAAYFLDPTKATPLLLRQAQAAQIAGEATMQAERELTAAQAEELVVAGVTPGQARQGFQTIAAAEELFVPLPGTTEQAITQEEQMAGVFGTSAAAQQRLRQRSRERAAAFEAGGRFAGQGTTVTGLQ